MDIIKAENVHYTYEDSGDSILRGIDLTVKEGEFLCILGHNGSGKSTLAKVLGGLFLPLVLLPGLGGEGGGILLLSLVEGFLCGVQGLAFFGQSRLQKRDGQLHWPLR